MNHPYNKRLDLGIMDDEDNEQDALTYLTNNNICVDDSNFNQNSNSNSTSNSITIDKSDFRFLVKQSLKKKKNHNKVLKLLEKYNMV